MKKLLDRLFQLEEINGADRCPTYLYRWTLAKVKKWGWGVYLHHFVGDDWSLDLHDHPKRFISIGLKGQYFRDHPCRRQGLPCPVDQNVSGRSHSPAQHDQRRRRMDSRYRIENRKTLGLLA